MKIFEVTKINEAVNDQEFFRRASSVLGDTEMTRLQQMVQDAGGVDKWLFQAKQDSDDVFQNPSNRAIRDRIFGVQSGLGSGGDPTSRPGIIDIASIPDTLPRGTAARGAANAAAAQTALDGIRFSGAAPEDMPRRPGQQTSGPAAVPPTTPTAAEPTAAVPPTTPTAAEPTATEPTAAEPTATNPQPTRPGQETSGPDLGQVTQTLRRGSRGEAVRVLQQSLGMSGNAVDGVFGSNTEAAVRQFQQNAGIQADGVVGRQTLSALQNRAVTGGPGTTNTAPGRLGNAPAPAARPAARLVDPQAAAAVAKTDARGRTRIGTDAGDGMVWIVGNSNALVRVRPNDPRVAAQQAAARVAGNESANNTNNALVEGITKLAGISNKKKLNEASMNISLNADSSAEVAELLRIMQLAGAGGAKAVDTAMINQTDSHMGGCGCSSCAAKQGPSEPDMGDMIRMISAEELATEEVDDGDFGDATTEPDETYMNDVSASIPSGNDLHKEKGSYPATAGGDNPMGIRETLWKALQEKKKKKPDADGDGVPDWADKKPGKDDHAGKKKGSKPKKGQVPPQFKKKTNEGEVQSPSHEISDVARKATQIAQMIKKKINSGDQMDDRDYNQMAELGTVLSRLGTSFGPKSMKDVLNHMIEYTDDRNQEGHDYPEFNADRFKELIAMAKR
jgi:peptidoglycan hydrolase-like protein with peptidoglycan-binding domain